MCSMRGVKVTLGCFFIFSSAESIPLYCKHFFFFFNKIILRKSLKYIYLILDFFFQIPLYNFEFERIQNKQFSSIAVQSVYTYMHCILLKVITTLQFYA